MKTRFTYLSLAAAVSLISLLSFQTAEAKIRVRASVRMPHVNIRINPVPVHRPHIVVRRVPLPVRCNTHYRITKQDRKMAKRLGNYSGVSKRELISLRRQGYSWSEIGRWIDLPRGAVYAARDSRSWTHFLRDEQWYAPRCVPQ